MKPTSPSLPAVVWFVPVGLLAIALLHMPNGYYVFLRLALCLTSGVIAYQFWSRSTLWGATFVGSALLYNPVFRIHLERETWSWINVATAAIYLAHWFWVGRKGVPVDRQSH